MKRLLWLLLLVPLLASAGSINPGRDIQGFKPNAGGTGPATGVTTVGSITATTTVTGTQLISNVATGTAPLVVTSATPVAGLNIGGNAATVTSVTGATGNIAGQAGTVASIAGSTGNAVSSTTSANLLGGTVQATQLGFQTGAGVGGSVTQAGGITSAVTLNTMSGKITTVSWSWTSGQLQNFTLNNTNIGVNDVVMISHANALAISLIAYASVTGAGTAIIQLYGLTTFASAEILNFVIVKGSIN